MSTPAAETVLLYPGDDPGSVAVLAENIRDGSRQLTLLSDGVGDARSSLHAAWKGEDADAADREIDTVVTICAALIERVNTAATAVDTHHADLVRIRAAVAQLREQWTTVRSALESLLLQDLFAPAWRTPVTAPSAPTPPINIGGFPMLSAAEAEQRRQAKIDAYEQDLTDLQTSWQALVDEQQASVVYVHPWEVDPDHPRMKTAGRRGFSTHYVGLGGTERKLQQLFRDFQFAPMRDVLGLAA